MILLFFYSFSLEYQLVNCMKYFCFNLLYFTHTKHTICVQFKNKFFTHGPTIRQPKRPTYANDQPRTVSWGSATLQNILVYFEIL